MPFPELPSHEQAGMGLRVRPCYRLVENGVITPECGLESHCDATFRHIDGQVQSRCCSWLRIPPHSISAVARASKGLDPSVIKPTVYSGFSSMSRWVCVRPAEMFSGC